MIDWLFEPAVPRILLIIVSVCWGIIAYKYWILSRDVTKLYKQAVEAQAQAKPLFGRYNADR